MNNKYINKDFPFFLHGGDYNPEQWINTPEIWDEDMRLMKKAHCNAASIGIFSWAALEPEEGKYDFSFLDEIMDKLEKNGCVAILATPSASRPIWLAKKYPEVLRTDANRQQNLYGTRHNHCLTSPVYRRKTAEINERLAMRYGNHPALFMWHISNELNGECHCELCQNAFRAWLKKKYNNDLDYLNYSWWNAFWSHTYTSWDQIESPSPRGEFLSNGLKLNWARFVTDQTADFLRNEIAAVRKYSGKPTTTNFMAGPFQGLDYNKLKNEIDVISWDSYPWWHSPEGNTSVAQRAAFHHDLYRSLKMKPFMLMESTPSVINYMRHNKLKRPGMHKLSSLQAVAHGSDTVQYFQWRKSRGQYEKLHGAVVDHSGRDDTRVFRDVCEVGKTLEKIHPILGSKTESRVAIYYDWENSWGLSFVQQNELSDKKYLDTLLAHHRYFWNNGINIDIIGPGEEYRFSDYTLIIAPMLYMLADGLDQRLSEYVSNGGTLVSTYMTGWTNSDDLCFLGGFPGGSLKELFGIWAEEIDELYSSDENHIRMNGSDGLSGTYTAVDMCEIVHPVTAEALAEYTDDFYTGSPALFKNPFGNGCAYYIASRTKDDFFNEFYGKLSKELNIKSVIDAKLPDGVTAHSRYDENSTYVFIENYNSYPVSLFSNWNFTDMETDKSVSGKIQLPPYGIRILKKTSF